MAAVSSSSTGLARIPKGKRPLVFVAIALLVFLLSRLGSEKDTTLRSDPSTQTDTTRSNSDTAKSVIDTLATQKYASDNRGNFRIKAKVKELKRLFGYFKALGLDKEESVVLLAGIHDGEFSASLLEKTPAVTFYGFDILKDQCEVASERLKAFPHASVLNLGWDEIAKENVPIGGTGKSSGLFDPDGQHGESLQDATAQTISLAEWTQTQGISQVLFCLIETEGHEPKVVRGMKLERLANRRRFPLFQYELGSSWAELDNRHGHDQWDQLATARYLIESGYRLFFVGKAEWLEIDADFFSTDSSNVVLKRSKTFGSYVNGNVLAMHPEYIPVELGKMITGDSRTIQV